MRLFPQRLGGVPGFRPTAWLVAGTPALNRWRAVGDDKSGRDAVVTTAPESSLGAPVVVHAPQLELLHAKFYSWINRTLWAMLGPDPARDDIAHDIFIRILSDARRVDDPLLLESWVTRMTMKRITRELRGRRVRRLLSFEALRDEQQPHVQPDLNGRELLLRVRRILELLPTEERLAVTLRLFEQASAERIADQCNFSASTARRRLASGTKRFQRLARKDLLISTWLRPPGRVGNGGGEP